MTNNFYSFISSTNEFETLYLNKDHICSVHQSSNDNACVIKMTNGNVFNVKYSAKEVIIKLKSQGE